METRSDGIERLARVSRIPLVSGFATESWKAALGWPSAKPDLALFDAYLKLHSDDAEVRELRAAAVKKLQGLAKSNESEQANPVIAAGLKALSQGELLQAESQFQNHLKVNAKDANALGGLGLVRMQQNRWEESLTLLTQASQQKNGNNWSKALLTARYQVLVARGSAAQREGDSLLARSLLQQAIKLDAKQNGAVLALAALQFEAGEVDTAEKTYRQVLAKNSGEVDALRGLSNLLAAGDKIDEARKLMDRLTPSSRRSAEMIACGPLWPAVWPRAPCDGVMWRWRKPRLNRRWHKTEATRGFAGNWPSCTRSKAATAKPEA
ncbi:tetratricopeptide repeat protein [Roseateles sp. GG27B]